MERGGYWMYAWKAFSGLYAAGRRAYLCEPQAWSDIRLTAFAPCSPPIRSPLILQVSARRRNIARQPQTNSILVPQPLSSLLRHGLVRQSSR